jgi:hypothetical protein
MLCFKAKRLKGLVIFALFGGFGPIARMGGVKRILHSVNALIQLRQTCL